MDCWDKLMDFWDKLLNGFIWLIDKLNNYNGLIIVILTVIGFIYIRKQIKIAKNKDILISFQKDINSYLNQIHSNHCEFYLKLQSMLNVFGDSNSIVNKNTDEFNNLISKPTSKLFDEIINFCENFEDKFFVTLENNLLNYDWWLSTHEDEFNKIMESDDLSNLLIFPKKYLEIINNIRSNCDEKTLFYNRDTLEKIKTEIRPISTEMIKYINNTNNKLNKLLKKLAKDKGVL